MKFTKLLAIMTVFAFVSGCGGGYDEPESGMADGVRNDGVEDASTAGYSETVISGIETSDIAGLGLGPEFSDPQNPLYKRIIFFEYDSSQVKQEFVEVVLAHSQYLVANPRRRVVLEGHADERGSREYNIALAEQRGNAVARMMKSQGVSPGQLKIVSYGEEKPAVDGHESDVYQQNRRVEIVYQGL